MLAGVRMRLLQSDEHFSLRGDSLQSAMAQDIANGSIPFYVIARHYVEFECNRMISFNW